MVWRNVSTAALLLQLALAMLVCSTLVNITVDDSAPDPRTGATWDYIPSGEWSFGPGCTKCTAKLDSTLTMSGTWHDSTVQPRDTFSSATLGFTGSAIYVYGVLSNFPNTAFTSRAEYLYYVDAELVGSLTLEPSGQPTFTYNYLLYANSTLPNGPHEFSVRNGGQGFPLASLLLLDYAVYTTRISTLKLCASLDFLDSFAHCASFESESFARELINIRVNRITFSIIRLAFVFTSIPYDLILVDVNAINISLRQEQSA